MLLARLLLLFVPAVLAPVSAASCPAQMLAESAPTDAGPLPYSVRTWTTREGLPQVSPRALAQTPDGYLWIGTFGGLARFDGVRFEVYDLSSHRELRSNRITSLLAARDGALWVGTEDAGVVRLEAGVFEPVGVRAGERIDSVWALCEDAAGRVWAGSSDGLFRCARSDAAGTGSELAFERDERVTGIVRDLCLEDSGELWIACADGLYRLREGRMESVLPDHWSDVTPAAGGGVWAAGRTLARFRGDAHESFGELPSSGSSSLYEDSEGVLWVACRSATFVLRDGEFALVDPEQGPLEAALQEVISILEDREGNLWFGGLRTGLSRVRPPWTWGSIPRAWLS
jgi:ligand-binding sensor domain-containing protein